MIKNLKPNKISQWLDIASIAMALFATFLAIAPVFIEGFNYWAMIGSLFFIMMTNWFSIVNYDGQFKAVSRHRMLYEDGMNEDQSRARRELMNNHLDYRKNASHWFKITALCLILACIRIYVPVVMDLAFDTCIIVILVYFYIIGSINGNVRKLTIVFLDRISGGMVHRIETRWNLAMYYEFTRDFEYD